MSPRSEYRNQVAACLTAAERMCYPSDRRAMLEIALMYLNLADRAGAREALWTARREEDRFGEKMDG